MHACESTDKVPAKKAKHILLLSGTFIGGVPVLAEARMRFAEGQGVQMQLTIRSTSDDVSTAIASSI
jgi:coatomer protein complex subunit gamma